MLTWTRYQALCQVQIGKQLSQRVEARLEKLGYLIDAGLTDVGRVAMENYTKALDAHRKILCQRSP